MKPGLLLSFLAAAGVHALLLFGGGPGSAAKPLPVSEEPPTLEASLIDSVPGEASPEPPLSEPETTPTAVPFPCPETVPPLIEPPPDHPRMKPEAALVPETAPLPPKVTPAPAPKKHTVSSSAARVKAVSGPRLPAAAERSGGDQNALPLGRGNPKPPYPPNALAAGHEGWVIVAIDVSAKGRPVSVELIRSSGFPELDGSALSTVRRWRFFPAKQAGKAVTSRVELPIRFQIDTP